jgi:hypothetical protein
MCHRSSLLLFLFVGLAAACGGATAPVGDSNATTGPQGGAGSGGTTTRPADTSDDGTVGGSSTGKKADNGAAKDAGPSVCDDTHACADDQWCVRAKGVCSGSGVCNTRPPPPPPSCPAYPDMFCGCDGHSYCSEEDANSLGMAIAVYGSCAAPCGTTTCDALTQYCDHGSGGVALPDGGSNEAWTCKSFADAGCASDRTCACIQKGPTPGNACSETGGHPRTEEFWP